MNCSECGAELPDNAAFCEACGARVSAETERAEPTTAPPPSAALAGVATPTPVLAAAATPPYVAEPAPPAASSRPSPYGAVNDRPTGNAFVITLVCVALLVAALGGVWYYERSEHRRLDALDSPVLGAEYESLERATVPLRAVSDSAVAETTKPQDFAPLLAAARTAADAYHQQSRIGQPLPSGRPWPAQFARASGLLDESLKYFGGVPYYLEQKAKAPKGKTMLDDAQNILNVAQRGIEPLAKLNAELDRMRGERDGGTWTYEVEKKTAYKDN